ncbi:MAG TPA: hypothetical protein VFE70_03195 [Candidatus Elarobacter sp.]|nr:hypothetical protein [Candidatus Elarobacter sp.]
MDTILSMIAFFALVISWLVLPATVPRARTEAPARPPVEAMQPAA